MDDQNEATAHDASTSTSHLPASSSADESHSAPPGFPFPMFSAMHATSSDATSDVALIPQVQVTAPSSEMTCTLDHPLCSSSQ